MTNKCDEISEVELIKQYPKKAINKLSVPMMLSMLLMMFNNLIDSVWVAGLGSNALVAVGFVYPIFLIISGICNGLGTGANSLISRAIGFNDGNKTNNATVHSILLTIFISIVITVFFLFSLRTLLVVFGVGDVLDLALSYGYIIVLGIIFQYLPTVFSAILRSEGAIKRAMYPMMMAAIINIIIDPVLIYGFDLGIVGAGLGTVLATAISSIPMIYWIFVKKDTYIDIDFGKYVFDWSLYKDMLFVGIPASLEQIILAILSIIVNNMLMVLSGAVAVAAYTVCWRIISVAITPATAIALSTITVAGIAFGARNLDNINVSLNYSIKLGTLISAAICAFLFIFSSIIPELFAHGNSDLEGNITLAVTILSFYVLTVSFGQTASSIFQSMGKGMTSLILTMIRELILVAVFAAIFGFVFKLGIVGVYVGIVVGGLIGSLIAYKYVIDYIEELKVSF